MGWLAQAPQEVLPTVRAYYWKAVPNFGDLLTPLLLKRFAKVETEWAAISEADLLCVGSILDTAKPDFNGTILGSGKLYERSSVPSGATILGLRGPLTAKGIKGDFALGDPGLLADELVEVETKKYHLGVVPHWSDKSLANDPRFSKYNPLVIDPRADPLTVIRQIGECRKIVASSLHGLIIADAFGIPRRFEYTPQFDKEGGTFKIRDHNESIGLPFEVGLTQEADRFQVQDRKHELFDMFEAYGDSL